MPQKQSPSQDEVRLRYQPAVGEGSRPDDPTCGPATGNRGDQVSNGEWCT